MNNSKLIAAAAGLAMAAGLTTAGTVYINGTEVGTFDGSSIDISNGDISLSGTITYDGAGCTNDISVRDGCQTQEDYPDGLDDCEFLGEAGPDEDLFYPGCQTSGDGEEDPPPSPGTCDDFNPPFPGDTTTVDGFPLPSGGPYKTAIDSGEYLAVEFTLGESSASKLEVAKGTHAQNPTATYAISPCPGDFSAMLTNESCKVEGSTLGSFYFNAGGVDSACPIEPGQTYFLNIIYATGSSNGSMEVTCEATRCGADLTWKDVSYLL